MVRRAVHNVRDLISANWPAGFEGRSGQPELTVRLNAIWENVPEPSTRLLVSSCVIKNKEVWRERAPYLGSTKATGMGGFSES